MVSTSNEPQPQLPEVEALQRRLRSAARNFGKWKLLRGVCSMRGVEPKPFRI